MIKDLQYLSLTRENRERRSGILDVSALGGIHGETEKGLTQSRKLPNAVVASLKEGILC
jgi:hypothetical protein